MSKGSDAATEAAATESEAIPAPDSNTELARAAEKRAAAADSADAVTRGDARGFVER